MVPARKCPKGALEGIVVNDRFRRPVDGGCHHFSILNVHANNKCAARRSICANFLLLLRSWCAQEGVTSLAGEFNKDAQRGNLDEPSLLLLSARLQCRGVRLATLSGPGTRSVSNTVALSTAAHHSRVAHQEDGCHGCGSQEDGPILAHWPVGYTCSHVRSKGIKSDRRLLRSSPEAQSICLAQRWVVIYLFFFFVSEQFVNQVAITSECSAYWSSTAFSTSDFSDNWYRWHDVRRAFSTWCRWWGSFLSELRYDSMNSHYLDIFSAAMLQSFLPWWDVFLIHPSDLHDWTWYFIPVSYVRSAKYIRIRCRRSPLKNTKSKGNL